MIAIFAAMDVEVQPFLRPASRGESSEVEGFPVTLASYGSLAAVICRTGIGRVAKEATESVLDRFPASAVLSVGTAGGVHPDLGPGRLVLCDRVSVSSASGYNDEDGVVLGDAELIEAARAALAACGVVATVAGSLTVDRVVTSVEEKARLREEFGHQIVEMESYWTGKAAADRGIPFLAVRVVSDAAGDEVVLTEIGRADGTVDYSRLAEWARQNPDRMNVIAQMAERIAAGVGGLEVVARALVDSMELREALAGAQARNRL